MLRRVESAHKIMHSSFLFKQFINNNLQCRFGCREIRNNFQLCQKWPITSMITTNFQPNLYLEVKNVERSIKILLQMLEIISFIF